MLTAENEKTLLELGFTYYEDEKCYFKAYYGSFITITNDGWEKKGHFQSDDDDSKHDLAILREKGIV